MSGDTFVISGLKEKRSAVAGRMIFRPTAIGP
jgi:hypothetical protein